MATPATVNPFNFYPGRDGLPLQNGYLYFGEPFQDPELQPLQAYWDDANTQPAARPIRTINGYPARNGAPAQVFVGAQYSMRVRDSQGREVFYAPNVTAVDLGGGGLDIITASGGQTVVTLTNAVYTPGSNAIDIALNGIIQISGQDYFETGTNRITMASALSAGDQIRAFARSTFGLTQAVLSDWQAEVFDGAGGGSQNFVLTRNPGAVANLDVSVTTAGVGSTLRPLIDYTLSGNTVTITPAPAVGTNNVLIRYGRSLPQDALRGELASTASAADNSGLVAYNDELTYAVGKIGRRVRDLGLVVNVPAGGADATSAINAKVLQAYLSMANVLTANEIYSVYVDLEHAKDYSVLGTILLPNGVVLRCNGSRLIGPDGSAGSAAYDSGGSHMIRSARWDGSAIVSNAAAANETTWRVIGMGVENATFLNSNCPLDLTNVQEQSFLDGLRFSNVSAPMRLKNCFYLSVGAFVKCIVRNSAQAAGQPAILMHGAAAHDMQFNVQLVNVGIGYECTATNSFSIEIRGSLEEGYANNSIGIRANNAYCQSWRVHAYCEGVRIGITTAGTGAFFACQFSPAYFSSCEYAMLAITSSFRSCTLDCASIPDEGVGIHNYVDLTAPNNDVLVRTSARGADSTSGMVATPSNILMGAGSRIIGCGFWKDTTDTTPGTNILALSTGALGNKASIGDFAWEGAQMVTKNLQVPFANQVIAGTTITLNTFINYDESNMLTCHIVISDFVGGPYTFNALIFGGTVYPLAAFSGGKGITVNNNAGYVQLVFTGLNTNSGASYQIKGGVRHM